MKLFQDHGIDASLVGGFYRFPSNIPRLQFGDPTPRYLRARPDEPHCWVDVDGKIWDLTLSQFEPEADPVSVIKAPDGRYIERTVHGGLTVARMDLELMGRLDQAEGLYREAADKIATAPAWVRAAAAVEVLSQEGK